MANNFYEVVYFDEETGGVGSMMVEAVSDTDACGIVEMAGEYEVIEVSMLDSFMYDTDHWAD